MKMLANLMIAILLMVTCLPQQVLAKDNDKEILYWVAPMDPNFRRDKPGKSPMGMDLVPVYADDEKTSGDGVTISPTVVQNLGVRTAVVERTRLWRGIDTVGYIGYDESRLSHVHLRTEGWIENLAVQSEGERVTKGERLFDLYSPELVNAQEEYVQALATGKKALKQASRDRLVALGIPQDQISQLTKDRKVRQTISIYAPQNGVVSSLMGREGMFVKPSLRVMSLADLSSVWLMAEVFERQADWVKVGQEAEVRLSYLPGEVWEGKVEYIYPDLDPKTRTLKVRLRFENPGETLKPNMYANVKIYGGPLDDVLVMPLEALIRTGRQDRAIVALGEGRFVAREVTMGIESGDYVEIKHGLKAGDKVVTSGQFLIDSEASVKASFERMSPPGEKTATDSGETVIAMGSGVIKSLMPEHHMLNMQHEEIAALGWPSMTMDFKVADGVDLSGLAVGESVDFEIQKQNDSYRITAIEKAGHQQKAMEMEK